jgi:hypothetical protein
MFVLFIWISATNEGIIFLINPSHFELDLIFSSQKESCKGFFLQKKILKMKTVFGNELNWTVLIIHGWDTKQFEKLKLFLLGMIPQRADFMLIN